MPEFILNKGSAEDARRFADLDAFTRGYIEAAFFCGIEDPCDDTGNTDADVGFSDLAPEALAEIVADCAAFQTAAAPLLGRACEGAYDEAQAGRDFWFTRNGHGVGFWDRAELDADALGDQLSALCGWRTRFPETDLYYGDDGRIYL